ncbi:MAG TPA: tRNA lysidine(34) synthetase TilS [Caproicibacter sp.]|nr:tRNA lysidine(34) synthetase TilS [Caproicibacter sp.]
MSDELAEIERKIENTVAQWSMLPQGSHIIIGLSGGADSIALTHFLLWHAEKYGLLLTAAHVNHGLRGEEADSDEKFVRDFCEKNGLKLEVLHTDVRAIAQKQSLGLEECGREVRYSFFRRLCGKDGKIATAHTLSDSAETVLMNLAKGAGTKGLCGIPPVRGNIVRPFIEITRSETEQYCYGYGLKFVTDSTNLNADVARNKIRLEAVPVLKQINPAFEKTILRTTQIMRCDETYFEHLADEKLQEAILSGGRYNLDILKEVPRAVLLRMIPAALERVSNTRLEFAHIEAIEKIISLGTGSVTVAGGIQCKISGNTLFIEKQHELIQKEWSVPFSTHGTSLPDGRMLFVKPVIFKNPEKINNLLFNNLINYDTILSISGFVRSRNPGDSYEPAGRGVTKTLKKLFNEAKIPTEERGKRAVLEYGGKILWVEGFGVSQEASVSENTKNIAEIVIKECR